MVGRGSRTGRNREALPRLRGRGEQGDTII